MDPYRVSHSLRSPTARSRQAENMSILGFAERLGKSKAIVAAPAVCKISDHQSGPTNLGIRFPRWRTFCFSSLLGVLDTSQDHVTRSFGGAKLLRNSMLSELEPISDIQSNNLTSSACSSMSSALLFPFVNRLLKHAILIMNAIKCLTCML